MSFGDSIPINPLAKTPAHPGSYQSDDDKTPAFIRRKSTAVTGVTTNPSDFDPTVEFPDIETSIGMEHQDKAGPSNPRGKNPQGQDEPKTPERKPDPKDHSLPTTSNNPEGGDEPSDDDDDDGCNPRRDPQSRSTNAPRPVKGASEGKNLPIPKLDKLEGANDF